MKRVEATKCLPTIYIRYRVYSTNSQLICVQVEIEENLSLSCEIPAMMLILLRNL